MAVRKSRRRKNIKRSMKRISRRKKIKGRVMVLSRLDLKNVPVNNNIQTSSGNVFNGITNPSQQIFILRTKRITRETTDDNKIIIKAADNAESSKEIIENFYDFVSSNTDNEDKKFKLISKNIESDNNGKFDTLDIVPYSNKPMNKMNKLSMKINDNNTVSVTNDDNYRIYTVNFRDRSKQPDEKGEYPLLKYEVYTVSYSNE